MDSDLFLDEPAQRPAANDVQMDVKDLLSAIAVAVHDHPVSGVGKTAVNSEPSSSENHFAHQFPLRVAKVVEGRDVALRNDENMEGRGWADVLEGHNPFIFKEFRCRDLSRRDLAEETVYVLVHDRLRLR